MNRITLIVLLLLIGSIGRSQQRYNVSHNAPDTRELEILISRCIDSSFHASVKISVYDTVKNLESEKVFSGVVVSAEGHVLTVAHAATPNQTYMVSFPNGLKKLAVGLGRIGFKNGRSNFDMAMIKIMGSGNWHYAKMGTNAGMALNTPAISISYPGSFKREVPNVRFGRITDLNVADNYIKSTCKMEPGDSGGPLFDINGSVIGLHSSIENSEEDNFEVPIDLYRKYWTALNVAKDYTELPLEETFDPPLKFKPVFTVPPTNNLVSLSTEMTSSVVAIQSKIGGKLRNILGTKITVTSGGVKRYYIVSKSSEVGDSLEVTSGGKKIPITLIRRDRENDLVILRSASRLAGSIALEYGTAEIKLVFKELGHFLISPMGADEKTVSVLSSLYCQMPLRSSIGDFGANARFIDQKITITEIRNGGGASGVLQLKDQVSAINGIAISKPAEYGEQLRKHLAGDSITVDVYRGGSPIQLKMLLPSFVEQGHAASRFLGGRSARSDGFRKVILHDGAIKANECGGPVFDIKGRFFGINIARHSRTSSVIMPADIILHCIREISKLEVSM